jgi:CRISPR-associated protein Cas2
VLAEAVGGDVLHLSALMCPAERFEIVGQVRKRPAKGNPCILSRTQLIEAGTTMLVRVTNDVSTKTPEGRRRLTEVARRAWDTTPDSTTPEGRRRLTEVARACLDFGQRVQGSVFECGVDTDAFARLRPRLLDVYDPAADSLRFYFLGSAKRRRVEHHGTKPSTDLSGPLIA